MNHLSTLPTTGEQARHALLLLGAPAPARLVVDVHVALFDGDLSMTALAALIRDSALGGPGFAAPSVGPGADSNPAPAGPGFAAPSVGPGAGSGTVPGLCAALRADLTAVPGLVALAEWSLERRIVTPAVRRADELAMIVRVAEFVAMRAGAGRAADRLLRELAQRVPDGVEAVDLAEAARAALADAELIAQLAAEVPVREAAALRAAALDPRQQCYGVPGVPHQRGGG